MQLSSGDVIEVARRLVATDMTDRTIEQWVNKGLVIPASTNPGQRGHHRFSLQQAVAIVYGVIHRDTFHAGPGWVDKVVQFVATVEPEHVEEAFAAGRTAVIYMPQGQTQFAAITLADDADTTAKQLARMLCLKTLWRQVERAAKDVQKARRRVFHDRAVKAGRSKKAKRRVGK